MNNQQLTPEQNYQVLLDALKYTSDIVVTLTEKNTLNEEKISMLEKTVQELKNLLIKNTKIIGELEKNLSQVEKNIITSINRDLLLIKSNQKANIELLSKTSNNLSTGNITSRIEVDDTMNSEEQLDLETINNTICNTGILSDVTSFNLEEIEKIKKQKAATSLVETLIRKKQELENKINDLTSNQDNKSQSVATVVVEKNKEQEKTVEELKDTKSIDINAIRRKKNFARKF